MEIDNVDQKEEEEDLERSFINLDISATDLLVHDLDDGQITPKKKKRISSAALSPGQTPPRKVVDIKDTPRKGKTSTTRKEIKYGNQIEKESLLRYFEQDPTSSVLQSTVLEVLGVHQSRKKHITQLINSIFEGVRADRTVSDSVRQKVYIGLKLKSGPLSLNLQDGKISEQIDFLHREITENFKLLEAISLNYPNITDQINKQRHLYMLISEKYEQLIKFYEEKLKNSSTNENLSEADKKILNDEIAKLSKLLVLKGTGEISFVESELINNVGGLPENLKEQCPFLFSIIEILLVGGESDIKDKKLKSACHALAILQSLRNQKLKNDFKLVFTILCVSYGAGERFIQMLNNIGLTVSWITFVRFMDRRACKKIELMKKKIKSSNPIILLMDNINIYRGKRRHIRLFDRTGPTMWNFTGRGIIYPQADMIENMSYDEILTSQKDPLLVTEQELFIESSIESKKVWEQAVDNFLLKVMNFTFNDLVPLIKTNCLQDLTKDELKVLLKNIHDSNFRKTKAKKIFITPSPVTDVLGSKKSELDILPLSLEDNNTIAGTLNILDEFANDFELAKYSAKETLPFDTKTNNFDLNLARSQFELTVMLSDHRLFMEEFKERILSNEKENIDEPSTNKSTTTLESQQKKFQLYDEPFFETFNTIVSSVNDYISTGDKSLYEKHLQKSKNEKISSSRDHLNRSLLHIAVEQRNFSLCEFLINVGCNVNEKEGCGVTPMVISVLKNDIEITKLLLKCGACFEGPLYTSIPSPYHLAERFNKELQNLFDEAASFSASIDSILYNIDTVSFIKKSQVSKEIEIENPHSNPARCSKGYVVPLVGDVLTCKTNAAVMGRSGAFDWVGICPGDLHNKGYFCEAIFKAHGTSGLHCLLYNILGRRALTSEVFKDKKFNDENLTKIREGVWDGHQAYTIAAMLEFSKSDFFPTNSELVTCIKIHKNHGPALLQAFKKWYQHCSEEDLAFKHHSSMFMLYGPLQALYDEVIHYGDGKVREIIYQILTPIYCQLSFPNYFTECFRHVINMLFKWPKYTRTILQYNCAVNISGKSGKGIELDAFVESEIVKPFKNYSSKHTTVEMSQKVMANIDLFRTVRYSYKSPETFDVHHTSKHKSSPSRPDQVKGAWYCLKNDFFKNKKRKHVTTISLSSKEEKTLHVEYLIDAYEKGKKKMGGKNLKAKLYDAFPDLRYTILAE